MSLHLLESKLLVHLIQRTGLQHQGDSPTLFEKCCGISKVPRIGLVEVGRPGQRLKAPTQGQRVVQTGDERPFLTYCTGVRSPAGNRTQATLVRGRRATNRSPEHQVMYNSDSYIVDNGFQLCTDTVTCGTRRKFSCQFIIL